MKGKAEVVGEYRAYTNYITTKWDTNRRQFNFFFVANELYKQCTSSEVVGIFSFKNIFIIR